MTVSEPQEDAYAGLEQLAMRVPSRREAAEVLGIEANAVKARLHRGRQQLKKLLMQKLERSL